jgi:NADH-quinone oxidoreductase subunit C
MHHSIEHRALAPLKQRFADTRFLVGEFRDMVTVIVPRERLVEVCTFLRDDPKLRYDMLADVNSVDYLNYPGAQHRFAVNYGLTSIDNSDRIWLKVFLDPEHDTAPGTAPRDEDLAEKGDPGLKVPSVTGVWPGAEWMEREVYDMICGESLPGMALGATRSAKTTRCAASANARITKSFRAKGRDSPPRRIKAPNKMLCPGCQFSFRCFCIHHTIFHHVVAEFC